MSTARRGSRRGRQGDRRFAAACGMVPFPVTRLPDGRIASSTTEISRRLADATLVPRAEYNMEPSATLDAVRMDRARLV